jgi:hypothetical protein
MLRAIDKPHVDQTYTEELELNWTTKSPCYYSVLDMYT